MTLGKLLNNLLVAEKRLDEAIWFQLCSPRKFRASKMAVIE